MVKKLLSFGYTQRVNPSKEHPELGMVTRLDREKFHAVLNDPSVAKKLQKIAEAVAAGKDYGKLKANLPAFIFMALCKDNGPRPLKETKLMTRKCIHDYDHLEGDLRALYEMKISPLIDTLGIQFAYITPSTHGIRLVTTMKDGETILQCQERVADIVGLKRDPAVSDTGRCIFAVSQSYVLYLDEEGLFSGLPEIEEDVFDKEYAEIQAQRKEGKKSGGIDSNDPPLLINNNEEMTFQNGTPSQPDTRNANEVSPICYAVYNGVKIEDIAKGVIEQKETNGEVTRGDRHRLIYKVALELRPVTAKNFRLTYAVLKPLFIAYDFTDQEIRDQISNGLNCQYGNTVNPSPLVISIINDIKRRQEDNNTDEKLSDENYPLPKLPPLMEKILSYFPERFHKQVVLASLPLFGTIGTGIRFMYNDNRTNSLSFQVNVLAESTSGKGFTAALMKMVMKKFIEQDQQARMLDEKERQERLATQNTKERQDKTVHPVTILPPRITCAQLMIRLSETMNKHKLLFNEEISTLLNALKNQYGDFTDIIKQGFDNGLGGKETATDNSPNICIPIYLNTLLCGTERKMRKFFSDDNIEDGLAFRTILLPLPDGVGEKMPVYGDINRKDRAQLDAFIEKLESVGKDSEDGTELIGVKVLNRHIGKWIDKQNSDYQETQEREWCRLSYRSAVIGLRAGVLMWYMWGCPNGINQNKDYENCGKKIQAILDFAVWVAEYTRLQQYRYFSKTIKKLRANNLFDVQTKMPRERFISLLPAEFLPSDWQSLRVSLGEKQDSNVHQTLIRLADRGLLEKCDDGKHWRRVSIAS